MHMRNASHVYIEVQSPYVTKLLVLNRRAGTSRLYPPSCIMLDETLSLAIESWILYALGCTMIIARMYEPVFHYIVDILLICWLSIARLFTLGSIRKLQLDDWIMVSTLVSSRPIF